MISPGVNRAQPWGYSVELGHPEEPSSKSTAPLRRRELVGAPHVKMSRCPLGTSCWMTLTFWRLQGIMRPYGRENIH